MSRVDDAEKLIADNTKLMASMCDVMDTQESTALSAGIIVDINSQCLLLLARIVDILEGNK